MFSPTSLLYETVCETFAKVVFRIDWEEFSLIIKTDKVEREMEKFRMVSAVDDGVS